MPAPSQGSGMELVMELLKGGRVPFSHAAADAATLPGVAVARDLSGNEFWYASQKCELAVYAVARGADPVSVSRFLHWKEFEEFVTRAFESFGYPVKHDFRFKTNGLRRQVDVVANLPGMLASVDCKHWSRAAGLPAACRDQAERSALLSSYLGGVKVLPIVATLGSSRVYEGVPVVSAGSLRDFLLNLDSYVDEFTVLGETPVSRSGPSSLL